MDYKFSGKDSSTIKEVSYNDETHELHVAFKSGGKYVYIGVPMDLYQKFSEAESFGKFFHRYIKNSFIFRKESF